MAATIAVERRQDTARRAKQARPRSRFNLPPTATCASFWRGGADRRGDGQGQSRLPRTGEGSLSRRDRRSRLGGYRDSNEGYVAAELRKAGFATLTYDSFAARGTTGAALQGSPGYLLPGVADAYAALRLLSGDPRIDADRIAIIGFSYGGEVAHLAAFETLRWHSIPARAGLPRTSRSIPAAIMADRRSRRLYRRAGADAARRARTKFAGGKDRELSGLCARRGAPAPIETVIYPGAYHAWTVPEIAGARFDPDFVSTKKCPPSCSGGRRLLCSSTARRRPSTRPLRCVHRRSAWRFVGIFHDLVESLRRVLCRAYKNA